MGGHQGRVSKNFRLESGASPIDSPTLNSYTGSRQDGLPIVYPSGWR